MTLESYTQILETFQLSDSAVGEFEADMAGLVFPTSDSTTLDTKQREKAILKTKLTQFLGKPISRPLVQQEFGGQPLLTSIGTPYRKLSVGGDQANVPTIRAFFGPSESWKIEGDLVEAILREECLQSTLLGCNSCFTKDATEIFETPQQLSGKLVYMNVSAFENECFRSLQHYSVHLQKLGARGVVLLLDERRALSMGVEEWQSFFIFNIPTFFVDERYLSIFRDMESIFPGSQAALPPYGFKRTRLKDYLAHLGESGLVVDYDNTMSLTRRGDLPSYQGTIWETTESVLRGEAESIKDNVQPVSCFVVHDTIFEKNETIRDMEYPEFGVGVPVSNAVRFMKLDPIDACATTDSCDLCRNALNVFKTENISTLSTDTGIVFVYSEIDFPCLNRRSQYLESLDKLDVNVTVVASIALSGFAEKAILSQNGLRSKIPSYVMSPHCYPLSKWSGVGELLVSKVAIEREQVSFPEEEEFESSFRLLTVDYASTPVHYSRQHWEDLLIGRLCSDNVYSFGAVLPGAGHPQFAFAFAGTVGPPQDQFKLGGDAVLVRDVDQITNCLGQQTSERRKTCLASLNNLRHYAGKLAFISSGTTEFHGLVNCSVNAKNENFGAHLRKCVNANQYLRVNCSVKSETQSFGAHLRKCVDANQYLRGTGAPHLPKFKYVKALQDGGAIGVVFGNKNENIFNVTEAGWNERIVIPAFNINFEDSQYGVHVLSEVDIPLLIDTCSSAVRQTTRILIGAYERTLPAYGKKREHLRKLYLPEIHNQMVNPENRSLVTTEDPGIGNESKAGDKWAYEIALWGGIGSVCCAVGFVTLLIRHYKGRLSQERRVRTVDLSSMPRANQNSGIIVEQGTYGWGPFRDRRSRPYV